MSYHLTLNAALDPQLFVKACKHQPQRPATLRGDLNYHIWSALVMFLLAAGGMGAATFISIKLGTLHTMASAILVPVCGTVVAMLVWYRFRRVMTSVSNKYILQSPMYNGPIEYVVDDQGFVMSSNLASWRVKWPGVQKVHCDQEGVFMFAGAFVYVIPRSAIEPGQLNQVFGDIKSWRETAA